MTLQDDKVIRFLDACERAGIKDPAAFLTSKRHMVYDWLKGCFPYNILPTDIDGLVHLNGFYLLLEFKDEYRLRNGAIPKGQQMCLANLHLTERFTVFLIGLNSEDCPTCIQVYKTNGAQTPLEETSREDVQERCRKWSDWAERTPPVERRN